VNGSFDKVVDGKIYRTAVKKKFCLPSIMGSKSKNPVINEVYGKKCENC